MPRSFKTPMVATAGVTTGHKSLRLVLLALLVLNAVAFYFYFLPPGGSQQDLTEQDQQIRNQIAALSKQGSRMKLMASRVQTGSIEIGDFQNRFFLPKRIAYGSVIEEIQHMARISGLKERDAGFSEEAIEGTNDLSLLNIKANYEGAYASLVRFLYESDRSPMLLMLDSLTAAPEKNGQIVADIRFQAVIQDRPATSAAPNSSLLPSSAVMSTEEPASEASVPAAVAPGSAESGDAKTVDSAKSLSQMNGVVSTHNPSRTVFAAPNAPAPNTPAPNTPAANTMDSARPPRSTPPTAAPARINPVSGGTSPGSQP